MTLTERRQRLLDSIWIHGPEHFDIDMAFWGFDGVGEQRMIREVVTGDGRWTACVWGHALLLTGEETTERACQACNPWREYGISSNVTSPQVWSKVKVDDWNMRDSLKERLAAGMERKAAEFWTVIEYLERLVKEGE